MTNKEANKLAKEYYKEYLKTDEAKAKMRQTGNPLEDALKSPFEILDFVKPKGTSITNAIGHNPGLVIIDIVNLNKSLEFNFKCKVVGSSRHEWYWGQNLEAITGTELETLLDEMKMTLGNLPFIQKANPAEIFKIGDLVAFKEAPPQLLNNILKVSFIHAEPDGNTTISCTDESGYIWRTYFTTAFELIQAVDSPFAIGDKVKYKAKYKANFAPLEIKETTMTVTKAMKNIIEVEHGVLIGAAALEKCCPFKIGDKVRVKIPDGFFKSTLTILEINDDIVTCIPTNMEKYCGWKLYYPQNELTWADLAEFEETVKKCVDKNIASYLKCKNNQLEIEQQLLTKKSELNKFSNLLDHPDELIDLKNVEHRYVKCVHSHCAQMNTSTKESIREEAVKNGYQGFDIKVKGLNNAGVDAIQQILEKIYDFAGIDSRFNSLDYNSIETGLFDLDIEIFKSRTVAVASLIDIAESLPGSSAASRNSGEPIHLSAAANQEIHNPPRR